ncbi:MAG: arginine--tRNA ligase, partial [Clostridia bacterium]|nr:arginine--tRNA ligase [Clostridia bacterium]
ARFFFNLREANSHFDFDLDLAVEQSSQNTLYYVQYAFARMCSIMRNLKADNIERVSAENCDLTLLNTAEERDLIVHLSALTEEVITAAKVYDPAKMTHYVNELATKFHKFYNACRVRGIDENLMHSRLALCEATGIAIKNVLNLMKIDAPESM